VSVEQAAAQADPTSEGTISFEVVFDQGVTGFVESDVDLGLSTAGDNLQSVLAGGPDSYTLTVTGMDRAGVVIARVPAAVCDGATGGLPNAASASLDNVITWIPKDGEDGAGGSGGASQGGDAEGGNGAPAPNEDGGCSCALPGSRRGRVAPVLALLLAALTTRRRTAPERRRR
jgi:hypothetical protein